MPFRRHDGVVADAQHQGRARIVFRQACLHAKTHQLVDIADIATFFEIALHDPFLDRTLQAKASRMADQQMRATRIRHAFDAIETKLDSDGLTQGQKILLRLRIAVLVADSRGQKPSMIDLFERQVRVQFERTPHHLGLIVMPAAERQFETPLAEKAPRTDRVGKNVDSHSRGHSNPPLLGFGVSEYHSGVRNPLF